ncbi:MAG: DNA primase [Bacteroidales bacterium]|nr:DNA primase [Bacteroidales bacterium]MDE5956519.1 DNA primase [Bacteroidales bacterium]
MIPHETVDRILDAAQIADVVGDFVTLKRRGANFTACCPFHNEKTPSFYVSPSKGIYKCFGCGKSGTAVGFVMEHERLSYVEALKYLAKKYNIEVLEKEVSAEEIALRQRNESLLLVSEYAGKFFQDSLYTPEGQSVGYAYFRSRGLEDETIRKYGLGWAPVDRGALSGAARQAGYKEEFLTETGLCIKYDDGRLVDRFYDRVMFPIHSVSGRVIAFGGRTLRTDKSVAKYVNSPETEIYVKSKSLYGIYFAKSEISRQDRCILVEGYLDVLSMHQLGITNVVASSGTSLTVEQIRLIKKFTDNITIIYDGDGAGIKAALRGITLVLKEGMNVNVVLLPDGQDPDDFARSHTLEEVNGYISSNSRDFIDFKTDLLLDEAGNDPLKKASLINDIADTIAMIPDAIVRAMYIRTSAEKFGIGEHLLSDRAGRTRTDMLTAEKKQAERDMGRARGQGDLPDASVPVPDYPEGYADAGQEQYQPAAVPAAEDGIIIDEPHLAPCEKELLGFILEEGCTMLEFDRDSKYYAEGQEINVAEFIDGIMADDEAEFANSSYRKVYNEYFRMYDEGLSQEQIRVRLLNSMDTEIAAVAKDLLIEKYQITVKNYEQSLTAVATILVQYIPKSLIVYQCKKVELIIRQLTAELAGTEDVSMQEDILVRISEYNKIKTKLNNEIGRV